jgi:hypothetical protein
MTKMTRVAKILTKKNFRRSRHFLPWQKSKNFMTSGGDNPPPKNFKMAYGKLKSLDAFVESQHLLKLKVDTALHTNFTCQEYSAIRAIR